MRFQRFFANEDGEITKAMGAGVTSRGIDHDGAERSHTDPLGGTSTFAYNWRGSLIQETDPLGRTFTIERDANDLVVRNIDFAGGVRECVRDDRGNPVQVKDPNGSVTTYTYDERSLMTGRIDPDGGEWRYACDAHGNLVEVTTPTGAVWRWTYDHWGRATSRTDPKGGIDYCVEFTYDGVGNVIQETQEVRGARQSVTLQRDAAGALTGVRTSLGHDQRIERSPFRSERIFRLDARTAIAEERDRIGLVETLRLPEGALLRSQHDATGNLREVRAAGAAETGRVYERGDRLIEKDGERFVWDAVGRLVARQLKEHAEGGALLAARSLVALVRETGPEDALSKDRAREALGALFDQNHGPYTPGELSDGQREVAGALTELGVDPPFGLFNLPGDAVERRRFLGLDAAKRASRSVWVVQRRRTPSWDVDRTAARPPP